VTLAEALGYGVRVHREHRGWTQEELAGRIRQLGLESWTRPTVAAVEAGSRKISVAELLVLALALGTSTVALLRKASPSLVLAETVEVPTGQIRRLLEGEKIEYGDMKVSEDASSWKALTEWLVEVARADGEALQKGVRATQPTLRLVWQDVLLAVEIQPLPGLREAADRPPKPPPAMQELVNSVEAEATGDFERYAAASLTERLGLAVTPEAVAFLSRLVWRKTAADQRASRAKDEGLTRHRAGRYVIQDLARMIEDDPDAAFEVRGNQLELAPPSAVNETAMVRRTGGAVTGKYGPLFTFLREAGDDEVTLSFQRVEQLIGERLPSSAVNHRAWWANDASHTQGNAWMSAGWRVKAVNLSARRVTFSRSEGG